MLCVTIALTLEEGRFKQESCTIEGLQLTDTWINNL